MQWALSTCLSFVLVRAVLGNTCSLKACTSVWKLLDDWLGGVGEDSSIGV